MPPKKSTLQSTPKRKSVVAATAAAASDHRATTAAPTTTTTTTTTTTSTGSCSNSKSKKRKADEDANILKYAQQIQQKELAKKQQLRLLLLQPTPQPKQVIGGVGTTVTVAPPTKKTSRSETRKSQSSVFKEEHVDNNDHDNVECDDSDDDEAIAIQPPSSKRRRMDNTNNWNTSTGSGGSIMGPISTSTTGTTSTSTTTNHHSHHSHQEHHHDRAKQWYEETFIAAVATTRAPAPQNQSNHAFHSEQQQRSTSDILSTPKPSQSSVLPVEASIIAAHHGPFTHSTTGTKTMTRNDNVTLTPPPPPRSTIATNTSTGTTGMHNSTTSHYRSQRKSMSSNIIDPPSSSQSVKTSMTSSKLHSKKKLSNQTMMPKAPFGSPIPMLSSALPQQQQQQQQQIQSPLPALPSVHELNIHEPTVLSPNYQRQNDYDGIDASYHSSTMQQQQQQQQQYSDTMHQQTDTFTHGDTEVNYRRAETVPIIVRNKDTWIASIAFLCVLLLSILVALVVDPPAVLPQSFTSYFASRMNGPVLTVVEKRPCFMDHPIRSNIEMEEEIALMGHSASTCDDQSQPCPRGGHCMNGELKMCYDDFLHVSPDGNSCVFTDQTQRDVDAIFDLVTKYTVQHVCTGPKRAKNPFFVRESSSSSSINEHHDESVISRDHSEAIRRRSPLFEYSSITDVLLLQYNPKLMLHVTNHNNENKINGERINKFLVERNEDDGSILIGLHPSQNVQLPIDCYVTKVTLSTMKTLLVWIGAMSVWIFSLVIEYYMEYPVILMILTTTISLVTMIRLKRGRARRAQVEFTNEVVSLRERVYDELMQDKNTSIPARIICDRIAWSLYPKSRQKRRRIQDVIFPCVSRDLETDSRIIISWRATTTGILGKTTTAPEVHWQWNDTQPHRSTGKM